MNRIVFWPVRQDTSQSFFFWLLAPISVLLLVSPAAADWHGQLRILSDYLYRGYSKSRSNPVAQGHLDFQHESGWYAGLGMSQVSFDDRSNTDHADVEFTPYLGWSLPISDGWRTDLSVTGYLYNDKVFAHDADFAELYGSVHYQDWLSARVAVAPDAYQRHATTLAYELNYRRDILDNVQFSAGLGYSQAKKLLQLDKGYFYWNLGASWFVTTYLSVDIRYVDVNLNKQDHTDPDHDEFYPRLQESKYLLSVTLGF